MQERPRQSSRSHDITRLGVNARTEEGDYTMTNKVQKHLVEMFLSEIAELLQDLGLERREDILREARKKLEGRVEDESGEFYFPNSLEYANDLRRAAGLDPVPPQKK